MTLGFIVAASVAGGTLSAGAAALALLLRASWVPMLVSFAIGALLGAAFLEVIPHAFSKGDAHATAAAILGGILGFFVLEKLLLWRHCHTEECEAHDRHAEPTDRGRAAVLIIAGDTAHNFVDGVLIAAAFLQSAELGMVTALAIVAHEIPQEVGDFLILLHSGWSRAKALAANMASSLATLVGGVMGYFALPALQGWEPVLLGIVASNMIYVAVADLIPGLHRRPELQATFAQVALMALGIGAVVLAGALIGDSH